MLIFKYKNNFFLFIIIIIIIIIRSPSHFTLDSFNINTNDNLILCVNNIRSILNMLENYYENYLEKYVDIKSINVDSITTHKDCDEILNLVELVIGVAVMCDEKAIFIQKIFGLDIDTQNVLKTLIQQVMSKSSINPNVNDNKNDNLSDEERISEDFRSNEMVLHLQTEIHRLENTVSELEQKNNILQEDSILLKETISHQESDNANLIKNANRTAESLVTIKNLQQELDEVTRDLDIQQVQNEKIESEKMDNLKKLESMREIQNRLEVDVRQLQDEVDVSRENKIKLDKAEKKADKFQQRLEELTELKKQNKEVTEKMDTYLDKIHELENSSVGNDKTLKKMIDHYKDKNVELETEKFELISKTELLNHNLALIKSDYDQVIDVRKRLEDEIKLLQFKIEQYEDGGDLNYKKTNSIDEMNGEDVDKDMKIIMLLTDVESLQKSKKDRETSLLDTKKQLLEANRLLESNNTPITSSNSNNCNQENSEISSSSFKDLEQKLSSTSNTVKLLEDRLKEKEGVINILEQDKSKLEIYSRRTLETFKEVIFLKSILYYIIL
jgi:hypothetical protein